MGNVPFQIALVLLCFTAVLTVSSADVPLANSGFDMKGTITGIISPERIIVGDVLVNLEGINTTGLYKPTYVYLMADLKSYYVGKDVLVKGNYAYLDLHGSYNSQSINEMIQKNIWDLEAIQSYRTAPKYNSSIRYSVM